MALHSQVLYRIPSHWSGAGIKHGRSVHPYFDHGHARPSVETPSLIPISVVSFRLQCRLLVL